MGRWITGGVTGLRTGVPCKEFVNAEAGKWLTGKALSYE